MCLQCQDFAEFAERTFKSGDGGKLFSTCASQLDSRDIDVENRCFARVVPGLRGANGFFGQTSASSVTRRSSCACTAR